MCIQTVTMTVIRIWKSLEHFVCCHKIDTESNRNEYENPTAENSLSKLNDAKMKRYFRKLKNGPIYMSDSNALKITLRTAKKSTCNTCNIIYTAFHPFTTWLFD